ncbi:MAG: pyridoxal kinase [Rhodospirillaceae bacterium]|nr:pyridoxal kinase [Rhodospirillaceae bacterium]|tara:strand:- start:1118 stop:1963 length:846 start_codon:yes stop_codon:yes gene_type:complete
MDILTIQSHVARGHVGLNAATLPLQLLGFEVDAVPTVVFSNHLGWPDFKGRALELDWVRDLIDGVAARGMDRCQCLLTGFIGTLELGDVVLHALDTIRAANPGALYACDPVMGNEEGFFVRPGMPEYLRDHIVPRADILFPNHMELEFLVGRTLATVDEALVAAREVQTMGPETVVVTSLEARDSFPDTIPVIAVGGDQAWQAKVARLDVPVDGAGDLVAAVFTAARLRGKTVPDALAHALGTTHGIMRKTVELKMPELALVAAQDEVTVPSQSVAVTSLA